MLVTSHHIGLEGLRDDINFDSCQIRINRGKGDKDRIVPFPPAFKEALALHANAMRSKGASHLFESS
jgi:integrase/recombinase XerD